MRIDLEKIKKIYEYHSVSTLDLKKSRGAFVFGRSDPLIAKKVQEIYKKDYIEWAMITGGVGKDSGIILAKQNVPESIWQGALLENLYGFPTDKLYLETKSRHGGENAEFGLKILLENNLNIDSLTVVAHPTSLRRLESTLSQKIQDKKLKISLQKIGIDYRFNSKNPKDQQEAIEELLRLADWPSQGFVVKQNDLPEDLVDYARDVKSKKFYID